MLTCAIRRSGISGLDLFFTTSTASGCWGSGGDGSGSVVSSSGAGSSGAGVAAASFGLNLIAVTDLMKQNQLYYYTYSEDFFITAFFILRVRDFSTSVLVAGGRVTPADCGVPATAMVTITVDVVDGSVCQTRGYRARHVA
jgi:hypothetical protein